MLSCFVRIVRGFLRGKHFPSLCSRNEKDSQSMGADKITEYNALARLRYDGQVFVQRQMTVKLRCVMDLSVSFATKQVNCKVKKSSTKKELKPVAHDKILNTEVSSKGGLNVNCSCCEGGIWLETTFRVLHRLPVFAQTDSQTINMLMSI